MGIDPDDLDETVNDVLVRRLPIDKVIVGREVDLVPANIDLAGAEAILLAKTGREYALQRALRDVESNYDFILIDCPPSLGILTINGLTAATRGRHPAAVRSALASRRRSTDRDARRHQALHEPGPRALGRHPDDVRRPLQARARGAQRRRACATRSRSSMPPVRKSIRFAEASQAGKSILSYAPSHPGADAYRAHRTRHRDREGRGG